MNDLVKRGDILNALIEKGQKSKRYKLGETWELNLSEIKEAVESVPSTEPERKKGNWIVKEEDWRKQLEWDECSECGFVTIKQYNFCPNCGADMW